MIKEFAVDYWWNSKIRNSTTLFPLVNECLSVGLCVDDQQCMSVWCVIDNCFLTEMAMHNVCDLYPFCSIEKQISFEIFQGLYNDWMKIG